MSKMKKEVKVPSVGESINTGVIVSWLKHSGDKVEEGENLFELETDKAVLEIPSPGAGILETLVEEGTEVVIGQTVAMLSSAKKEKKSAPPEQKGPSEAEKNKGKPVLSAVEGMPSPQPAVEAKEKTKEPDLTQKPDIAAWPGIETHEEETAGPALSAAEGIAVPPSTEPVVVSTEKRAPENRRSERVPMTAIRKRTAERLVKAMQSTAYITTFNEIDMQKVIDIRMQYKDQFQKEHGIKIGFMSFFVKASVQALKEFLAVNTQVEGGDIIYKYFYDIGVAVSIDEGLIVPVIRDADTLHFAEVEKAIADLAKRAKEKKLKPDELSGGTFTITNGGIFGSLLSTPIPAYPQTAILGMHVIKNRPVVIDEKITIRPMMYVALSYDHRVIDGREAVGFLARIKEYIENPDKLLLEL
jgi:2-oxoglutarate dehydrogenase E2 component (dihydrolipoamide succinyltransferase)